MFWHLKFLFIYCGKNLAIFVKILATFSSEHLITLVRSPKSELKKKDGLVQLALSKLPKFLTVWSLFKTSCRDSTLEVKFLCHFTPMTEGR